MKKGIAILVSLILAVGCAPNTNNNSILENAINQLANSKNLEYKVENNYYYPEEVAKELAINNAVTVNYNESDSSYVSKTDSQTKIVTDDTTKDFFVTTFMQYGKESGNIVQQEDKWVKTVWLNADENADLEINKIKKILQNHEKVEALSEGDSSFYRVFENKENALAELNKAANESYSIDFTKYSPFYIDVYLNPDGNITKMDCSQSSYGYLVKLYTGAMLTNADSTFKDFVPCSYFITEINYNAPKVELPAVDTVVKREVKSHAGK